MEFDNDIGEDGKYYEIKEVYYNRDGTLMGYCDAVVGGGSIKDVISVLDVMKADAHKSVVRQSDFKKEVEDGSKE